MMRWWWVGLGGVLGAWARYGLDDLVYRLTRDPVFPYGTIVVNGLGCLVIGFLATLGEHRGLFSPESRALVFIGFLGAFTTFSTFGYETVALLRDGEFLRASMNVGVHLVLAIGGVWGGMALADIVAGG